MLEKGNFVKVADKELTFHEAEGTIVDIKEDAEDGYTIGVTIANHFSWMLGHSFREGGVTWFKKNELERISVLSPEVRAEELFKGMWHSVRTFVNPLDTEKKCMHKDCHEKRTTRIMVNIWGTVAEFDVCNKHAEEWHGKCADAFPQDTAA